MGSASFSSSWQLCVKCARSLHIAHVEVARGGRVEVDDGVSDHLAEDVGAFIANICGDFDQCQDDRVADVVDPASITFSV